LPEEGLLIEQGVQVVYLEPEEAKIRKTFKSVTFLKFEVWRVLSPRYDRVQFLDGDVLPNVNMDYAFTLLEGTPHTDAFGAGVLEPAQAGWFLATPNRSTFETLNAAFRHDWDGKLWGGRAAHNWTNLKKGGDGWGYNAGANDQGLLYYYARYLSHGSCAIFYYHHLESWHTNSSELDSERVVSEPLPSGGRKPGFLLRNGDYTHYTGPHKPWLVPNPNPRWLKTFYEVKNATSPRFRSMLDLTFPLERPLAGFHRKR
jgi:hypothetical protein